MIAESLSHLAQSLFAPIEDGIQVATPAGILALGLVIGLRHAMEADHISAVSTLVTTNAKKLRHASMLGALWGIGHTGTLLVAGTAVLLLAVNIPVKLSGTLEFGVGVMLVFLGASALTGFDTGKFLRGIVRSGKAHQHSHSHFHADSGIIHSHDHDHHDHAHGHKSVIFGMVHGLAGSGALMLVVLTAIDSVPLGLAYIAIFGAGSIASMVAMSTLIGLPLSRARNRKVGIMIKYASAVIAIAIGISLIYELGIAHQVFL